MEEIQRLINQARDRFGGSGPDGQRPALPSVPPVLIAGLALLGYLLTGIFIVAPDERGIVLRFGKVVRQAEPGPGYHLPWPIETVLKPAVTQIRKEEFGFRTISIGPPARYSDVDPEALMLTGDENIVKLQFIVQYKIKPDDQGISDFLFNVRDPQQTLRDAAEAAMRQIAGTNSIDDVLTEGRERIQEDAQKLMQQILDGYDVGIEVVTIQLQDVDPPDQVSDAFKDVISAQQDKERMINEAVGYANDVVPKARGQAAQLINEAQAYAQVKVQDATGQAQRFLALQEEYAKAKDVTRLRLYLETMEVILPQTKKILLDRQAGEHVLPYLPLEPGVKRPLEATTAEVP